MSRLCIVYALRINRRKYERWLWRQSASYFRPFPTRSTQYGARSISLNSELFIVQQALIRHNCTDRDSKGTVEDS